MTIRQRRDKLDEEFRALEEAAEALKAECLHPIFIEAFTMIGCIQPVQMCEDCYFVKPIESYKYVVGVDFSNGVDSSVT